MSDLPYYAAGLGVPYLLCLSLSPQILRWHLIAATLLVRMLATIYFAMLSPKDLFAASMIAVILHYLFGFAWAGSVIMFVGYFALNAAFLHWRKTGSEKLEPHERVQFPEPC